MFQPADKKITTAEVKRIYKQYMKETGYLKKDDIAWQADAMVSDIHDHEEYLKANLDQEKDNYQEGIRALKDDLQELKRDLAKCTDAVGRAELEDDIEVTTEDLNRDESQIENASKALAAFKEDKREFLINYINNQIHGSKWRDITT